LVEVAVHGGLGKGSADSKLLSYAKVYLMMEEEVMLLLFQWNADFELQQQLLVFKGSE
jgi:hypothetical protein